MKVKFTKDAKKFISVSEWPTVQDYVVYAV